MPASLNFLPENSPRFTGRQIVSLPHGRDRNHISNVVNTSSIRLANFNDYQAEDAAYTRAFEEADGVVFDKLNVAIVSSHKNDVLQDLVIKNTVDTDLYTEPERYVYALHGPAGEFMRGYQAAVENLANHFGKETATPSVANVFKDDAVASWGIHATGIQNSGYTGKGVRIAILDTGFFAGHPDFSARNITTKKCVQGSMDGDALGHGSHCTGISTGNLNTQTSRRYGVAKDAQIFHGKVLSDQGVGSDGSIFAGIEWAMNNHCRVISMSLGAPVNPGESYARTYNDVAQRALLQNTLIIAAAGNDSNRTNGVCKPVNHPANCPAIMAVAALDNNLQVSYFSCAGINGEGGQVDIAAPGVDVYSSWIGPQNYNTISGTSMATPFVAGIAALFFEAYPNATAGEVWAMLVQRAKRLNLSAADIGAGLVQAP